MYEQLGGWPIGMITHARMLIGIIVGAVIVSHCFPHDHSHYSYCYILTSMINTALFSVVLAVCFCFDNCYYFQLWRRLPLPQLNCCCSDHDSDCSSHSGDAWGPAQNSSTPIGDGWILHCLQKSMSRDPAQSGRHTLLYLKGRRTQTVYTLAPQSTYLNRDYFVLAEQE